MLRDVMTHAPRSERKIAGGQSLSHRDQVRDNLPVIDGKPRAGAAEAGHDFVSDHQDAVLVAQLAYSFEVAVGRDENSIGPDHGFEDERSNGVWAFELDGFFDHGEGSFGGFPAALDAVVGIKHANHSGNARLSGPAARVSRERDAAGSSAMVSAVARHNLVTSGEEARDLDGVLVGLSAAVGKEKGVEDRKS